jgi:hypothetical protein
MVEIEMRAASESGADILPPAVAAAVPIESGHRHDRIKWLARHRLGSATAACPGSIVSQHDLPEPFRDTTDQISSRMTHGI